MKRIRLGVPCLVAALAIGSVGAISTPVHASTPNSHARGNYVSAAAARAAAAARVLANEANACRPVGSAHCVALAREAAAAEARARALAAKAGLPAPVLPAIANQAVAVVPASSTVSAGGAPVTQTLPSTGGGVPAGSGGSPLLPLAALMLTVGGLSLRRFASHA